MKMGAIIRLVCFTSQNKKSFTFQSVNYEYNALFSFVFSNLYKQKLCVSLPGSYIYFPCCTSSYINCVLPYRIYACSDTTKSTRNGGCTRVTAICEEVISLASEWQNVTKRATVLLTLILYSKHQPGPYTCSGGGGGGGGRGNCLKIIFTIFRMSY